MESAATFFLEEMFLTLRHQEPQGNWINVSDPLYCLGYGIRNYAKKDPPYSVMWAKIIQCGYWL